MQHYFLLSWENFYSEKQHSNKVLPSDARGAANNAPPCIGLYSGVTSDDTEALKAGLDDGRA